MAVGSSIIIKVHKEGGCRPPVMHLWVDLKAVASYKGGYIEQME